MQPVLPSVPTNDQPTFESGPLEAVLPLKDSLRMIQGTMPVEVFTDDWGLL
jgi:hypothetical protein